MGKDQAESDQHHKEDALRLWNIDLRAIHYQATVPRLRA